MKTKVIQLVPVLVVLLVIGIRYFGLWCVYATSVCYGGIIHQMFPYIITPLYLFCFSFLFLAIILVFVPRTIFQSWFRFAMWFIPLSVVLIAITPVTSNSWMPLFFISREEVSWYLGALFAAASLVLVIWKYFSARRVQ